MQLDSFAGSERCRCVQMSTIDRSPESESRATRKLRHSYAQPIPPGQKSSSGKSAGVKGFLTSMGQPENSFRTPPYSAPTRSAQRKREKSRLANAKSSTKTMQGNEVGNCTPIQPERSLRTLLGYGRHLAFPSPERTAYFNLWKTLRGDKSGPLGPRLEEIMIAPATRPVKLTRHASLRALIRFSPRERSIYCFFGPSSGFPGKVSGTNLPWSIRTLPPTITNSIPVLGSIGAW